MKELSIEEKAARYDRSLERARNVHTYYCDDREQLRKIEHIFPELAESEDERIRKALIEGFKVMNAGSYGECTFSNYNIPVIDIITWLEKQGEQNTSEWKQDNVEELTEFENVMMHIGSSFFGENTGLDPNDTNVIKEQANLLLELVPKQEWSEEDEEMLNTIANSLDRGRVERVWHTTTEKVFNWLKSLKDRYTWKPSDEQMDALCYVTNFDYGGYKATLVSLYEQLKKLKG